MAVVVPILVLAGILSSGFETPDQLAAKRGAMVRVQIEGRGIENRDVLRVMRATPRHLFVPPDEVARAYEDRPLAIGFGATISQPYVVALMTELLGPQPAHKVLEVGTGSGYQAAILSQLVSHVYTVELMAELAARSRATLSRLGYRNVTVKQGDGYLGWPEQAPFDRVIVTAAPTDIPPRLVDQLARGGRIVAPVGPEHRQELIVIDKLKSGELKRTSAGAVAFVPMRKSRE
jgi:protein-L-isoaspartate(D-aspartate) O-methyltransferase